MIGLIDFLLLGIFGVVVWCVASEGAFGAGLNFLCVLFAGLLAMNFFEPVADILESAITIYADVVSLVGLFTLLTLLLRSLTEKIAPTEIELEVRVYEIGRWAFAAITGYTTMAILLTALHTAPLPRNFIGFRPERKNFLNISAPDRQWLGFTQHVSENVFARYVRTCRGQRRQRIFDGTMFSAPGREEDPIWPSFPIRYATRRERYAAGTASRSRRLPDKGRSSQKRPSSKKRRSHQGF